MEWRDRPMETAIAALFLLLPPLLSVSGAEFSAKIGVNYGTLGDNLPSPAKSVELIKSINGGRVKIYDANPKILTALKNTNLQVSIMVPNNLIVNISSNQSLADDWIRSNVLPYLPETLIRYILVGNEILSYMDDANRKTWFALVPAMRKINFALKTCNISKVKVSSPMAMDVLESSYPPSNGTFRPNIALSVIRPMLQFLKKTKSFFFVDCYPYFVWSQNYPNIKLDYALLNDSGVNYVDHASGLTYTNLLDQMLDSVVFAMKKLGFPDVRLWISETGWPNGCDVEQFGGNVHNAATYNRNLVKRLTSKPPLGTPARPNAVLPAFVFSLFNENRKPGPGTERHWGVFYPNGRKVYPIDLSGSTPISSYPNIPLGRNNAPYKGRAWCVLARGVRNVSRIRDAVTYACSQGNGTCDAVGPGKECYRPNSLVAHASYVFSSYWSRFRSQGATCYFDGLAVETTRDPSRGSCKYPSVTLP